jgi:hypothetical protein
MTACAHAYPCLCKARQRLAGKRPVRRRALPSPMPAAPAPPAYVCLLLEPPRRDVCPACGHPLRVYGCVTYKTTALRPNVHGLTALSHVGCRGTPTGRHVLALGAPLP